jgi:hypothetical protein
MRRIKEIKQIKDIYFVSKWFQPNSTSLNPSKYEDKMTIEKYIQFRIFFG